MTILCGPIQPCPEKACILPGTDEAGAMATLIGGALDLEAVGAASGTIGYEVLTSLGRRFARRYVAG